MRMQLGPQQTLFIHLTLVPYIAATKEIKTKPTNIPSKNYVPLVFSRIF